MNLRVGGRIRDFARFGRPEVNCKMFVTRTTTAHHLQLSLGLLPSKETIKFRMAYVDCPSFPPPPYEPRPPSYEEICRTNSDYIINDDHSVRPFSDDESNRLEGQNEEPPGYLPTSSVPKRHGRSLL